LEGTYKDHQVQLPDHFRAGQKLKRVTKGMVQAPLKHCQDWGISQLCRKPVAVFDHTLGKEMLLRVQLKPPLAQISAVPRRPVCRRVAEVTRARREEAVGTGKWGRREEQSKGDGGAAGTGELVLLSQQCRRGYFCLCSGQAGPPPSQRSSARWSGKRCSACQTLSVRSECTTPLLQVGTRGGHIVG